MAIQILFSTPAQKQFAELDGTTKKRVRIALLQLAKSKTGDIKKLKGTRGREDLFRLRIGDYRAIYFEESAAIKVIQIIHRSKGYSWL